MDNTIEVLKFSLIKRLFDNIIYKSNPLNYDFDYLIFDCDERLITRRQIHYINDDIVERLKNSSSVYVKMNQMQEE